MVAQVESRSGLLGWDDDGSRYGGGPTMAMVVGWDVMVEKEI